jgi:beta-glucosidase
VRAGENVSVSVNVKNTGSRSGEEVVQLYVTELEASAPVPIRSLQGFRRLQLKAGETKMVSFKLTPRQLSLIDAELKRVVEPGTFEISVGGKQPGFNGIADSHTSGVLTGKFKVSGSRVQISEKQD